MSLARFMFDTVAGKLEDGPYSPKDPSRNAWETHTREFFEPRVQTRRISTAHFLNRPEARIAILGDGLILRVETSLPKLVHGNNLSTVCRTDAALNLLQQFVSDHVDGHIADTREMEFLRVDFCHNFRVGMALPDYVATLGGVSFLQHRATTDGFDGVEWWNAGRKIRAYDKHHEILEKDKRDIPQARGVLRFEVQIRKKAGFLQRRLKAKRLTFADVLDPAVAYCTLVETLDKMHLRSRFVPKDSARTQLDAKLSYPRATRLLGLIRRLESQTVEDLKRSSPRGTYFRDKRELSKLGLWPPNATDCELPGLDLPPLQQLLDEQEMQVGNGENLCADFAKQA